MRRRRYTYQSLETGREWKFRTFEDLLAFLGQPEPLEHHSGEEIGDPWLLGIFLGLCIVSVPLMVIAISLYWWFIA